MKRYKKRATLVTVWLIIFLFFFPAKSHGYIFSAIGLDIARINPRQNDWHDAWAAGFGVAFPLTRHFTFFLNFGRWRFQVSSRDYRLLGGHLTVSPLTSGLYFVLLPRKAVSPVFSLGGGYIFTQYRQSEKGLVTIPEIIKITKSVKGNFGWEAGAGLVVMVSRRAHVFFQMERYQTSLKVETTTVDLNLGTIKRSENIHFVPYLYRIGFNFSL